MSLIACKDKSKKHRVKASGELPRQDYYCPNVTCDAIMTLVDCDDEIKTDHFRIKQGYCHVKNCPYANNNLTLVLGDFTNEELLKVKIVLDKTKQNLFAIYLYLKDSRKSNDNIDKMVYAFSEWLGYDIRKNHIKQGVTLKIEKLYNHLSCIDEKKFVYGGNKKRRIASIKPWKNCRIKLYDNFFTRSHTDYIELQGTVIHEICHQVFHCFDMGVYGYKIKNLPKKLRPLFADAWSNCFEEVLFSRGLL